MLNKKIYITKHVPGLFETSFFKLTNQQKKYIKLHNPNLCECASCGVKFSKIPDKGVQIRHHHNAGVQTIQGALCIKCSREPEVAIKNTLEDLCARTGKPLEIYKSWRV